MVYATGRSFLDADSHVMELPDFLTSHADPDIRDRLPALPFEIGGTALHDWDQAAEHGAHSPETVEELIALGDDLLAGPKAYQALGAFNAAGSLGFIVGPLVGGAVSEIVAARTDWQTGYSAAFTVAGLAEVVLVLATVPALRRLVRSGRTT